MRLRFTRLKKSLLVFKQLSGLSVAEFEKVVERITQGWKEIEAQKKSPGRHSHLPTLEDKVLCLMIYYRTYITHTFLGYLVGLHNSNVCRLFKKMEPLLAKKITIKKDRSLTPDKILKRLADVTEQKTQRPKDPKERKKTYSGKKKAHTIKTEIVIEESGKIISVSKSHKGRTHDFRIRKKERMLPSSAIKYADSGYQGWQKIQSNESDFL